MHYYQFNIGDYASHTRHLEPMEDLIYRRLLDLYYLHERPLNDDASVVAKQIGLRDMAATVRDVLNEFFERTDDGYRSARADKEIAHFHSKIEQASRAGKASAERRVNARSTDVQPTNNQEPITNNHKPKKEQQRGSRLPTQVENIQEWVNFCQTERPDLVFDKVYSQFRDYWIAQPGQKGVKLDWDATWRNWVRRQSAPKQSYAQQAADIVRTTVPGPKGPDPALQKIEQDRQKAVPMPANIRQQINSVLRKV